MNCLELWWINAEMWINRGMKKSYYTTRKGWFEIEDSPAIEAKNMREKFKFFLQLLEVFNESHTFQHTSTLL